MGRKKKQTKKVFKLINKLEKNTMKLTNEQRVITLSLARYDLVTVDGLYEFVMHMIELHEKEFHEEKKK